MTPVEVEKILGVANIPNLIVVEFKSFILDYMELGLVDQLNVENIPNYKDYLDSATEQGMGYAVLDNGKPIVCFGLVELWPHVAECWLIPDVRMIKKWKFQFHKGSLNFMEEAAKELNLHRIHVTVDKHNPIALKWIRRMKFSEEGLLKKYSYSGQDMVMYGRIFDR